MSEALAYYNEFDPAAAAWLRELIAVGHITPGFVDERSIEDVRPDELLGYTQCHFFAGVGGWSLALRLAGWPDDKPVWTGSCPCQPFSQAGQGAGFDDERHLWPAFQWLIAQCRPSVIFGEQVASKATGPWFDLVQADLEAMGYAFGCVPFPASSVGAPHIRDRAYWVADAGSSRSAAGVSEAEGRHQREPNFANDGSCELSRAEQRPKDSGLAEAGSAGGLADSQSGGLRKQRSAVGPGDVRHADSGGDASGRLEHADTERCGEAGPPSAEGVQPRAGASSGLGNPISIGRQSQPPGLPEHGEGVESAQREQKRGVEASGDVLGSEPPTGPTNGHWGAADWLLCRDGKWRPVEPGTFPLVDGIPRGVVPECDPGAPGYAQKTAEARVMRLKGYGNAIVPQQAAEFIRAACV